MQTLLQSLDPRLWYLFTAGVVWLILWLWRRYLPSVWAALTARNPAFSQLPIILIGGLINAAPALGKPLWQFVQETVIGAVLSAVSAQGFHAALKALPGKYDGAEARVDAAMARRTLPNDPPAPPAGT